MSPKRTNTDERSVAEALMAYLEREDYKPLVQRELLHRMHVPPERLAAFRQLIRGLQDRGKIVKLSRGRLAAAAPGGSIRGILHRHRDGYGFVVPEDGGEDLFVAPRDLGESMSGDQVVARITRRGRAGRQQGVLVKILKRRSRSVLGLFIKRGRGGVVRPFDPAVGETIAVPAPFCSGAGQHHVVKLELLKAGRDGRPPEGKVLAVLGHLDDPGTDVLAVTHKYGLSTTIPAAVLSAARRLPSRIGPASKEGRRRFDDPPPVTIDGETAQDFDDAIAVKELRGGGFRLFVHIADVSHFVTPGSILDREALHRGTSVYFPGTVLPMFPEKLSNDLCSLRPGVDRLVQSVILDIDDSGSIKKSRFADGVIRSAARLSYTQVAKALQQGGRGHGVPARLIPMLRAADGLRQALERRRRRRGSIDFDLPEPQLLLDVEGAVTGITVQPRNIAHRMIEECMLIANEAVALYLEQRNAPCMYRIHEQPDPLKLEVLVDFARSMGLRFDEPAGEVLPGDIQRLVEASEGRREQSLLQQMALRSMKQARYSMSNCGHFGLAMPTYCHFTSPIRRYPDLVVHRLLRQVRRRRGAHDEGLQGVAETASELERNAEAAERELLAWKKVALIHGREGEEFDGVVTGVARFGLFVQLAENLVEGLLRVERLSRERFEYVESRLELRGVESGRTYRVGERLRVRVDRVDRALRRVDFSLARHGAPPGPRARSQRGARKRRVQQGTRGPGRARPRRTNGQRR